MKVSVSTCASLLFSSLMLLVSPASADENTDRVNPFIGSGGLGFGVGALNPGPYVAHGMVKLGPDTTLHGVHPGFAHCGGYWYPDPEIRAFTHTHPSGIGVADYGNIGIMPTIGFTSANTRERNYRSTYSHDSEVASTGYYAVTLEESNIRVELTAAKRAGYHRITFPTADDATLVIDPTIGVQDGETVDAHIEWDPVNQVARGWQHYKGGLSGRFGGMVIYFVMDFDRDFPYYGTWVDGTVTAAGVSADGPDVGLLLGFDARAGDQVEVKVGLSYISMDQARLNLDADIPNFGFEETQARAVASWEDSLGVIEVEGGTSTQQRIFYSTLYRTTGMPTDFTEVGDIYLGFDKKVRDIEGYHFYSDLSMWDTYRTLHPLYNIIYPQVQRDVLQSLGRMYQQSGDMPRWPMAQGETGSMIGEPADIVFADSYIKGITDFDLQAALPGLGERHDWDDYVDELGFFPMESGGDSVSEHLEFTYNDYAFGVLLKAIGQEEEAQRRMERSLTFENLFSPESGFIQGRHEDGTFHTPYWPYLFNANMYTEGNGWQLLWFVHQDTPRLVELLGGNTQFRRKLEQFFESSARKKDTLLPDPDYWHGNEPDLQAGYLFNYVGRHDLTAKWVRWILDAKYRDAPDGLDGNDDGGTLSAWYVFSAMGFYPIPAQDLYLIGSPLFERSVMHMAGGDFIIEAPGASDENIYIQGATLNGEPLNRSWFTHSEIKSGATLVLNMGPEPSNWGGTGAEAPPAGVSRR